jgi:hypothetical protein
MQHAKQKKIGLMLVDLKLSRFVVMTRVRETERLKKIETSLAA